ncbi:MAG: hypothetical protein A4S12_09035 [Proteobacteria bacterium SG_bin5]|nr:hypothetical protein [Sphingomonas sp.]OQW41148.1 MAG: hypothetical protein A4S12_09035 [Proteobacteria bacterium SG_bin5]
MDIAERHRATDRSLGQTPFAVVPRFLPLSGAAREKLLQSLRLEKPGIGHLQPDGSWVILPADERCATACRPKPMEMHAYIDEDGDEFVLFTPNEGRALAIYEAYRRDTQALPGNWVAQTYEYWLTLGLVRHERQARRRGVEGLGRYTPAGWLILPIDYERLGLPTP